MLLHQIEDAIVVDEIGIRAARHEEYVITALYRPIFALEDRKLALAAVQGVPGIHAGRTAVIGAWQVGQVVGESWRMLAMSLATVLQAENLVPADLGDVDLLLDIDPSLLGNLQPLAAKLRPNDEYAAFMRPHTGAVLLGLPPGARQDPALLAPALAAARAEGFGIATDLPLYSRLAPLPAPGLVRLSGRAVLQLHGTDKAEELMRLTSILRARGVRLLVENIKSAEMLQSALAIHPDLLAGDLLGRPEPAGTWLDRDERPAEAFLSA